MHKHIAKKWAAALRSGHYTQGVEQIRFVTKTGKTEFCVLGVLCNLHAQAHPKLAATQTDPTEYLGEVDQLPVEVMRWAGIQSSAGNVNLYGRQYTSLAEANDFGVPFKVLADWIEQNWFLL